MAAWNELPPHRPSILATFLGKITRNISISRWRSRSAHKRGGGEIILALEELDECVADMQNVEANYIRKEAVAAFNRFLDTLPEQNQLGSGYSQYSGYSDFLLDYNRWVNYNGYYALYDLNGDGVEELLLGNNEDSFTSVMSMVDGEIADYLCLIK